MFDINTIVDKLLDMKPDPIPTFALLKEFKKISTDSNEYQNAYDKVIDHPFVKSLRQSRMKEDFGLLSWAF